MCVKRGTVLDCFSMYGIKDIGEIMLSTFVHSS